VAIVVVFTEVRPARAEWHPRARPHLWSQAFHTPEQAVQSAVDHGYSLVLGDGGSVLARVDV
jgi:hypothetical protein